MRRYLGLGVEAAEHNMPGWERQMLLEELLKDRPWIQYVVLVDLPEEEQAADLADLGVSVRTVS